MTQAVVAPDRYLTDFRKGLSSEGPGWLRELRREAFSRFSELGFPTARRGNERWKYTNVTPIAEASFERPADSAAGLTPADLRRRVPWDDAWSRLVFVDGRYSAALSAAPRAEGVSAANLWDALRSDTDVIEGNLARQATIQDDAFAALNTAFLRDGAFVHVPGGLTLEAPLHIVFVSTGATSSAVAYPRTLIVAGAQSDLALIESYVGLSPKRYFTNAVTEMVLGEGARVEHYKLLLESEQAYHVASTRVTQARDSTFSSTFFARGAAIARNDLGVTLDGEGSSAFLNGLYLTSGTQHIDNFINIDHAKPYTTSRLFYKGILDGRSNAVFGGRVLVRPDAQKSDAHQEDKNLILSAEAEVDSKPSLEIYADDVKCGHGATAGTIAEDALFYMRSRGLDLETATTFLIKGFASGVLDTIRVAPLRRFLDRLTSKALKGARFAERS